MPRKKAAAKSEAEETTEVLDTKDKYAVFFGGNQPVIQAKVENSSSRNHTAYHCRMYTEVSGRCKSSITESDLLDRTGTGN